jgi:hypothetical protein
MMAETTIFGNQNLSLRLPTALTVLHSATMNSSLAGLSQIKACIE